MAVVEVTPKSSVATSFDLWGRPGHFRAHLAKGPKSTTWIWNIHADAHEFDGHKGTYEGVAQKIFSAHFGHLAIIFLWLSGMWFHGARFSNYSAWLANPTLVTPSSHVVWPIVGQEILNADVGGGFSGIEVTSGWFPLWRSAGITSELELYWTSIGALVLSATMIFAGWFHYHVYAPKIRWFLRVESMLNHHLSGLLGLGCLSWAGHQIHISLPINKLLDAGVAPRDIPAPNDFLFNRELMGSLYPGFKQGLEPFFTLDWGVYSDFLTFKGGLNPYTGSLWLSDIAHHHLALAVIFIIAGHMYRTNWRLGHRLKDILEAHKGPLTGDGHKGLFEHLRTSFHAQLALNLAMLGSVSIIVSHHMYAMTPYPYLGISYSTQLSLFTHHMWIGGFCIVGGGAHAGLFMVRDYCPQISYNNVLDRLLLHRDAVISHLNWVCIFLGAHSFGLYIHNDTMGALGRPNDLFADSALELQPFFAQWVQTLHTLYIGTTCPRIIEPASYVFGGDVCSIGGRIVIMPIGLGTADFMIHHIHAFQLHVATLILLKGALFARNSRLIPDKYKLGFRFPCDGPGRGGTCQVSAWDHIFLALFWMYNCISITIFHYHWKMMSDVWGSVSPTGGITHLFSGNFANTSLDVNGWLRAYLWRTSADVIGSYGSPTAAYGLTFLLGHFTWAFSLMFLFSGRGFWQELIESLMWAHAKVGLNIGINPRALSITQGRAVGVTHYLAGGIAVTWSFFLASTSALS